MATDQDGVPLVYYEDPNSLLGINSQIYNGLLAIGTFATISVIFTSALLTFITWRLVVWKSYYRSNIHHNQPLILIYQLLWADFLQSLGFLISFHWASEHEIIGPSGACFAQGWLIQLGDVASAFFVLAIAAHTTYQVTLSRGVSYKILIGGIVGIWAFALLLTTLAPVIGGRFIFLRAGVWCWISSEHESLRLLLHYLWIFVVQFSSILIYAIGFYYLYRSKAKRTGAIRINGSSEEAIRKASAAMLAYSLVYTFLSLPLAAGRMAAMSNNQLPESYFLFAGVLFTCSGWVDTLLYALTRRTLLFKELDGEANHASAANNNGRLNGRIPRQNSTESILTRAGFTSTGQGGIMMDRTVKVELDDLESQASTEHEHKGYFVSAKAGRD